MKRLLTWLGRRRHPYEPLITVEISASRLLSNLEVFRKFVPNCMIAPVLKSNAYGHGLFEIAEILENASRGSGSSRMNATMPFFVVDSYFEAVALRARGFKTPILVIGYTRPETIMKANLKKTSFIVTSLDELRELDGLKHPVSIQVKFDTGMHRQGLLPDETAAALEILSANKHLFLEGICTHFADADNVNTAFTRQQIVMWDGIVSRFMTVFPDIKYIHAAATDGSRFSQMMQCNLIRLGIGLYGLSENPELTGKMDLKPAMSMKTIVTGVKKLYSGESVGYGGTFVADRDMTIATIPVGYFEGVDRRLSGKGFVQVGPNKIACPIIGRVSMNITVIDVSKVPNVFVGTGVVVISREPEDSNSVHNMAKLSGAITYEEVVHIPAHLKRVVVE